MQGQIKYHSDASKRKVLYFLVVNQVDSGVSSRVARNRVRVSEGNRRAQGKEPLLGRRCKQFIQVEGGPHR